MNIKQIHIGGFGSLKNKGLHLIAPASLVYGPNEAGKSTLLGFIRAVLFGFPPRGSAERFAPGDGSAHGGAIVLEDASGNTVRIERWDAEPDGRGRAPAAGSVRVRFADRSIGGERELSELLSGVTPELFRSLFAFGLTELQELRTLQHGEISGYLYGAGLGASGLGLRSAERKLAGELEQLYKPRGRTPRINRELQELGAAENELRYSLAQAGRYDALREDETRLAGELAAMEVGAGTLRKEADRLKRVWKARPHRLRCRELRTELEGLPELTDWPEDALSRWEQLQSELERLQVEQSRIRLEADSVTTALVKAQEASEAEGDVLADRAELEHLSERYAAYEDTGRLIVEAETEERQLDQELRQQLRRIQPEWTESTLEALPSLVMLREQAAGFREEWRDWQREDSLLAAETARLELEAAGAAVGDASSMSGPEGGLDPQQGLELLRRGRKLYYAWREAAREAELAAGAAAGPRSRSAGRGQRSDASRLPLAALLALTLLVPAALALLRQPAAALTALLLLAAGSAAWLLASRSRSTAGA
ncbi:AAA family ATPase, partial [Paenibacillus filicis]